MAVLSHTVQRQALVYGCTPDPHELLMVLGETGLGTMSHQHAALTDLLWGFQSDDTSVWPVSGFPSISLLNVLYFHLGAFHVIPAGCLQSSRRQQTELFIDHDSDTVLILPFEHLF